MANLYRMFRICRTMCKEGHLARNEAWSEAVQAARDLCQEAFSCREDAQKSRIEDLFSIVETGKNFQAFPREVFRRCADEVHGVPCKQALHTSAAVLETDGNHWKPYVKPVFSTMLGYFCTFLRFCMVLWNEHCGIGQR